MERMGFRVTHLYGLTECYGPATVCVEQARWPDLPLAERAALMARQGVRYPTLAESMVADPETMAPVPARRRDAGRGHAARQHVMKGYLKNPSATAEAFRGDWYHTGDLAVLHPDGYVEVKDRSKDIIISGGENISSLEVEEALYRHPAVMEAAVVAMPTSAGASALRLRHAEAGCRGRRGRDHRLVPRAPRPLQGPGAGGVRPAAEDLDRQVAAVAFFFTLLAFDNIAERAFGCVRVRAAGWWRMPHLIELPRSLFDPGAWCHGSSLDRPGSRARARRMEPRGWARAAPRGAAGVAAGVREEPRMGTAQPSVPDPVPSAAPGRRAGGDAAACGSPAVTRPSPERLAARRATTPRGQTARRRAP